MSALQGIDRGLKFLCEVQLADGEMPSEADVVPGALPEGRSAAHNVFISTFVHDALEPFIQSNAPERERANQVRQGILRFLLDHQEANATWRFLGRGSRMDADADTTSCAAAAVLNRFNRLQLLAGLERFKDRFGLYPSYVDEKGTRYSWILSSGSVVTGHDRVVQANVARFLECAGKSCQPVWDLLEREVTETSLVTGSPDYPSPVTFLFMVARACEAGRRTADPLSAKVKAALRDWLSAPPPVTEAPFSHAIAALSWLKLGGDAALVQGTSAQLASAQLADGGWPAESFFVGGYRSRALTTALATSFLHLSCRTSP